MSLTETSQPQGNPLRWSSASGRQIRSVRVLADGKEIEAFGPFHVRLQVRMSFLEGSEAILDFFVYESSAERAVQRAGRLLKKWIVDARKPYDGYPKPEGLAAAQSLTHREFRKRLKQAENTCKGLCFEGAKGDPTAFYAPGANRSFVFEGHAGGERAVQNPDRVSKIPTL